MLLCEIKSSVDALSACRMSLNFENGTQEIRLLSKQAAHSSQHAIFLWVVGMVFARDLQNGREGCSVGIDSVSYFVGNMLIYQDNTNIFSFGEVVKRGLDRGRLGLVVDDEKVLLSIGARCNVPDASKEQARD
jgi:hypothetical protein